MPNKSSNQTTRRVEHDGVDKGAMFKQIRKVRWWLYFITVVRVHKTLLKLNQWMSEWLGETEADLVPAV